MLDTVVYNICFAGEKTMRWRLCTRKARRMMRIQRNLTEIWIKKSGILRFRLISPSKVCSELHTKQNIYYQTSYRYLQASFPGTATKGTGYEKGSLLFSSLLEHHTCLPKIVRRCTIIAPLSKHDQNDIKKCPCPNISLCAPDPGDFQISKLTSPALYTPAHSPNNPTTS